MRRALLVSSVFVAVGCARPGARGPDGAPVRRYVQEKGLPGSATLAFAATGPRPPTLVDAPFPSVLWEREGKPVLDGFPGADLRFFQGYFAEAKRRGAWGRVPMIYFRLSGPAAIADVAARETMSNPGAAFGLVELDERGGITRRIPVELHRFPKATGLVPGGLVALAPRPGFALAPGKQHAAYVRRSAASPALGTNDLFEHVKSTEPRLQPEEESLRSAHGSAFDALEASGVPREDVAGLAVFRTGTPESYAARAVEAVAREPAQRPLPGSVVVHQDAPGYLAVAGMYCTPNLQAGVQHAPFVQKGGETALAVVSAGNLPDCGGRLRARFVLSLPKTPMPPDGYPFVVSAHGTMGDAASILGARGFADLAAREGVAVLSTDQPLHGKEGDPAARPGVGGDVSIKIGPISIPVSGLSAQMLFYNPIRPAASLGNMMQAVADAAYLGRAFRGLSLDGFGLPAPLAGIRLSTRPPALAGHSQGSQSLAILGAIDPETPAVLLSGCGGEIRFGVLGNQEFAKFRGTIEPMLGLERGELVREHPVLALAEWVGEPADPLVYAAAYAGKATHLLHVGGVGDTYNPDAAANALAVALRAVPVAPSPQKIPELAWLGIDEAPVVSGVRAVAYASFTPKPGRNGHFVAFDDAGANAMVSRFLGQTARGERPDVRR